MSIPRLDNFASIIHRNLVKPQIIVFGSRFLGTDRPSSDVDVVILSDSFHGLGVYERSKMIAQAKAELDWPADIILRTSSEWERPGFIHSMVQSQHYERDDWRRLFDLAGRKIRYRDLLAWRAGMQF